MDTVPRQRGGRPGPVLPYDLLAGVVPCRGGWLVLSGKLVGTVLNPETPQVVRRFADVLDHIPNYNVVAVSVPIGLAGDWSPRGRKCDQDARRLLGWPMLGAVLSPPGRNDLAANRPLPGEDIRRYLVMRIAEVDAEMAPYRQRSVYAAHPELSFRQLNDDRSLVHSKRTKAGEDERHDLLLRRLPTFTSVVTDELDGATRSHVLDAAALLWTARRIAGRAATRVPVDPEWDDAGLRTEWVC